MNLWTKKLKTHRQSDKRFPWLFSLFVCVLVSGLFLALCSGAHAMTMGANCPMAHAARPMACCVPGKCHMASQTGTMPSAPQPVCCMGCCRCGSSQQPEALTKVSLEHETIPVLLPPTIAPWPALRDSVYQRRSHLLSSSSPSPAEQPPQA